MPQDPDLYGQRPAKKKKTEMGLSNTLDFAAQLQSLIRSKPSSRSGGGGGGGHETGAASSTASRPLAFSSSIKKKAREAAAEDDSGKNGKRKRGKAPWIKQPPGGSGAEVIDAYEREQIRTNMAAKARRYAMMQRGDYVPKEGEGPSLVDFDRKWAERKEQRGGSSSDSDSDSDSHDDSGSGDEQDGRKQPQEMVEHIDEFGRTRLLSRAARDRELRRRERAERATQDLAELRARPAPPPDAIYGDVIQTEAIEAAIDRPVPWGKGTGADADEVAPTHYRAQDDVRTRGAAFYAFATEDEEKRAAQMRALADERTKTETARAERSAQLEARRQEMAARRAALAERKAKKQADSFLDGLEKDLFAGGEEGAGNSDGK